jgi:tetratricopeptide (TPR) repeat protein
MAEGLIGGILGDEDEKPEVEAAEALTSASAYAAAIAAMASRQDPGVARKTEEFLSEQSHLLKMQAQVLKDEHALRLTNLQGQAREGKLRRTGIRIRIAFQLFAAIVAAVIGVGILILIHDAVTARQVVIEPFAVPPSLAPHGLTGKVVAGSVLDELSRLQDATRSNAVARGLSGAWTSDIKLEVPETGLSLSEISHLLVERFGHNVHIDGDVFETQKGDLALTVRGNGVPPRTFSDPTNEMQKLVVQAAEYIYSQSQPGRWAAYLTEVGRDQEALTFCPSALAAAELAERPSILNYWGIALQNTTDSSREALTLFRAAVKLQPDYWNAHNNIMNAFVALGDEEGAWRAGQDLRRIAGGRPGRAQENNYQNWDLLTWNLQTWLKGLLADAESNAGVGTGATSVGPAIADVQARLHDPEAAELAVKTKGDSNDPSVAAIAHFVHGRLAAEAGDIAQAVSEMEAFGTAFASPFVSTNYPGYNCWIALAEEAAGNAAKADAILQSAGGTFVDCYRFHADILDNRGDWPGAQKAYADAVALAPHLPAAYYSWGVALARHGDLDGAAVKLKDANQRGPHWADPLKVWGDVLLKQRRMKEALAKYDAALEYAPNWKQLKEAREAAAKQKT